jgi:hypothetical protein
MRSRSLELACELTFPEGALTGNVVNNDSYGTVPDVTWDKRPETFLFELGY